MLLVEIDELEWPALHAQPYTTCGTSINRTLGFGSASALECSSYRLLSGRDLTQVNNGDFPSTWTEKRILFTSHRIFARRS